MKLENVLDKLNSFEKNSFLKILENIRLSNPKNSKAVDRILSQHDNEIKNIDNINISRVFGLLEEEFIKTLKDAFLNTTSQIDILIDILIRDGNCIMSREWFNTLYEREVRNIKKKTRSLENSFKDNSSIEISKKRDYRIYKTCLEVAYKNDLTNNQDEKITQDELSILIALSNQLRLSQEEVKLINYMVVPLKKEEIDRIIDELKNIGAVFYSKKNHTIYIPDEVVRVLRRVRGKEVADKFFRRVLRLMREPQINLICRNHNIDWKGINVTEKIENIIREGVSFSGVLKEDAFKPETTLTERKNTLNDLCNKGLKIIPHLKGSTLEEKTENLIKHFEQIERDENVGISVDGYQKLLTELGETLSKFDKKIKDFFEFQDSDILRSEFLIDFNIKPRDILEIMSEDEIKTFCAKRDISTRGNEHINILKNYKNVGNILLENYENIAFRNLKALKENGIVLKEAKLGNKFEDLTKEIFKQLGLNVDEPLRRQINTRKDKIDIVLNLGKNSIIIVECKSIKEAGYNKFSSVSRQIKSYTELAKKRDFIVLKSLLIAPEFSDDFISDCNLDYELNLSLISAESLINILTGFKASSLNKFPHKLLLRDVIIKDEMVLKALKN